MKKAIIVIIFIFSILTLLVIMLPNLNQSFIKQGNLYISKILASNESTKKDNYGAYSDYIEIYNGYSYKVNIKDYHLSDSEYKTNKWTFPDITINPKESLIIYASGNDTCDLDNRICHTNFKLNSAGETLTLTDNHGNIINKFKYPKQYPDTFYGYVSNKYTFIDNEGKEISKANPKVSNYKLSITEYMTHNKRSVYDSYGNYYDWVEIYNSDKDYTLESLYITDDATNLKKYHIPSVELLKDKYLVIYFAGKKVNYQDGIYTDFKLSDDDKEIIISNGEKIIDKVSIVVLNDDISYGITKEGWAYFTTPTPGRDNNTTSFKTWGG